MRLRGGVVRRSGGPVTDTQDAGIGPIVIGLVAVAVLLTVCCVVFWRMTRPVPLAVSRPLRPAISRRQARGSRQRIP